LSVNRDDSYEVSELPALCCLLSNISFCFRERPKVYIKEDVEAERDGLGAFIEGSGTSRAMAEGSGTIRAMAEGSGTVRARVEGSGTIRAVGEGSGTIRAVGEGSGTIRALRDGTVKARYSVMYFFFRV